MSLLEEPASIALSKIIPLHLVAGSSSPYAYFMAKALLERGSDPNARDSSGVTPVHVAASWGHYETLKLLLLNGGDPELEDEDGQRAIDLARHENRAECVQLLSWWLANAKLATPTSSAQKGSPVILTYGSPSSPYQPKYFTSPILDSPKSRYSPISGGSGVRKMTPVTCSPKPVPSGSRRTLVYSECRQFQDVKDRIDGNRVGKCDCQSAEIKFEKLPPTPRREQFNRRDDIESGKNETVDEEPAEIRNLSVSTMSPAVNRDDKEAHEQLQQLEIDNEVRIQRLSLVDDGLNTFSQKLNETLRLDASGRREVLAVLEKTVLEENRDIDPRRLSECNKLTDAELRRELINQGMDVGPITPGTRFLYTRRLATLLSAQAGQGTQQKKYSPELQGLVDGRLNVDACRQDDSQLVLSFDLPANGKRQWREGCLKMSFCYLLLDPTITKDLHSRSSGMSESECLQTFVDAIFYIGKGKTSRPFQHLLEAASLAADSTVANAKLSKILQLWRQGYGVISLHVFQNIIPVEAYTREAAMIDAIGLDRLCNQKRGDYYGAAANWALGRRRRFGAYLLKSAASTFLCEREKQLKRDDVLKPAST